MPIPQLVLAESKTQKGSYIIIDGKQRLPDVLTPDEFRALLAELTAQPYRTMVILAGRLGLGRSEFVGVKWADIN